MTSPEQRTATQDAVRQALAESDNVDDAIRGALRAVGEGLSSSFGVFWTRDALTDVLRPAYVWRSDEAAAVSQATIETALPDTLERGAGAPGRVWETGAVVWTTDHPVLDKMPRRELPAGGALRSVLAFPIATHDEFLGVIELFGRQTGAPDDAQQHTLTDLGLHIGEFIARRRATDAEREAGSLSAALVAVALDCIVTIDAEGRVLEFNPAAERTFGYTRAELLGKPMVDFIVPPDLRDAHRRGMARYLATGEAHLLGRRVTIRGHRKDETIFPVELTILRVDRPGPPIFTAYLRDLSEQKRLEAVRDLLLGASEMLAASLDYEETLRNLSRVVVPAFSDWYAVDVRGDDGTLRRLEIAHRDPAKLSIVHELAERYPESRDDSGGVRQVIRTGTSLLMPDIPDQLLVDGARDAEHLRLLRALGLRSAMIVPLKVDGHTVGAITFVTAESGRRYDQRSLGVAEDVARRASQAIEKARLFAEVTVAREQLEQQATELETQASELEETAAELESSVDDLRTANDALLARTHEAERAMADAERARHEADEANRAKSEFLAAMSHELRTPLNAIIGYAQLMDVGVHGTLTVQQHEDLKRIDRSSQHLLGLITDILNFAKIEAGRVEYHLERVPVLQVLERVEELVAPQARGKQLAYELIDPCPDALVCVDTEKLIQVFVNLVSNAVRYTAAGGRIQLACRATPTHVYVDVCDTGVGIPADKLEAIFEPFVQVDLEYAGQRQGTGLGLAISRDLARGMGGGLTVHSEVGKGSVFTVALRREPGHEPARNA